MLMKKLLFSILLTMASAIAMNVSAGTRTIYLDANIWNTGDAIFAVHVWNTGDIDAQGYQLTHVEGSIYTAEIRDDATNAIFVRKDPNAENTTIDVFAGEWNRSGTTIPSDKNQYKITAWHENNDDSKPSIGEWSVYGVTPEPEPVGTRTIYLDANMWNTDDAIFAIHVWKNESDATDYNLTHIEGSIYEVEIRDDAPYAIFLRKDPNNVDVNNVWVGEWNRSETTIPNDKDQYRITAWKVDENCTPNETTTCPSAGEWSMYMPNQPSTETVYEREVRVGYYGTICLPFSSNNITGVTLYSIAGQTEDGNGLYLDSESELQAGVPYFFLANSTKLVVTATGESTFTPNADHWYPSGNGLVGYINDGQEEYIPQNLYHYMLKDNGLYQVNSIAIVRSNYAYVNWSAVPTTTAELAPGRQRLVIGAQHTTTGVDNIEQTITPTKILRDGQLLIIRDGQLFTITGQMVK